MLFSDVHVLARFFVSSRLLLRRQGTDCAEALLTHRRIFTAYSRAPAAGYDEKYYAQLYAANLIQLKKRYIFAKEMLCCEAFLITTLFPILLFCFSLQKSLQWIYKTADNVHNEKYQIHNKNRSIF